MPVKKLATIQYPKVLVDAAEAISTARQILNESNPDPYYKRGSENKRINDDGVLCELIARYYCYTSGYKFSGSPLIADKPVKAADLSIDVNGKRYRVDVKLGHTDKFAVNERAHVSKGKESDFYWFVVLLPDNTAGLYSVRVNDVSEWELKQMKYTPAYVFNVNTIGQTAA